ncbi:hypothetical protein GOL30_30280 [Sinorhizobium medicae]|nr:hypothetical protein [Sinorhizobium medicae]MDX0437933.1 hypothetical protein [Sinorhizobium medicae]MDX0455966.1 hypothetical protein [Sinorhizobium medicae]MDX0493872.1 hypothetical protein [Sinorhizobium medicae]MDX0506108.1 hypothetical protein [Sinorhizobium medicae]
MNSNERRSIDGLAPGAIKQIEGIRTRFGADLNFINEQSGRAPTAHSRFCQASANEAANHEAESTASIDDDIAGTVEVWTREIKDRDLSVWRAFMAIALNGALCVGAIISHHVCGGSFDVVCIRQA